MGKSGGDTTTQKSDPWIGSQPYLLGSTTFNDDTGEVIGSTPGIYEEAARLYADGGFSPDMYNYLNQQRSNLEGRTGQAQQAYDVGNNILSGKYDPNITPVSNVSATMSGGVSPVSNVSATMSGGVSPVANASGAGNVTAQTIDTSKALSSMGAANPTQSIQQMLSGQANTSTLDPVVNNAMTRLSDNFNEQVMPGLRNEAVASGQYGSSRQGIAEGLAAKGLSQSMGDLSSNMYNNAYNTAQSLMGTTANNMAGLGLNAAQANASNNLQAGLANASNQLANNQFNANLGLQNNAQALQNNQYNASAQNAADQFNANLGLQNNAQALQNNQYNASAQNAADQFNANLGLQNNSQAFQQAQQQLSNQAQGLSALSQGNQLQDNNYSQLMSLLDTPNNYAWSNLNKYASIVTPGAGLGGTTTSTTPSSSNGAATAAGLMVSLMALLSDRRYKRDIERVGQLDNGLPVYKFKYLHDDETHIGVMADEVKATHPTAVTTVNGVDYVNYGVI